MKTIDTEVSIGVWYDGHECLPPENLPVLVCTDLREYWVDRIINGMWSTCVSYPREVHLYWQLPALPEQCPLLVD